MTEVGRGRDRDGAVSFKDHEDNDDVLYKTPSLKVIPTLVT